MTNRFQCCVSPSVTKAHLFDTENPDNPLVLCEATTRVQSFTGSVFVGVLCKRCIKIALEKLGNPPTLTAADIGVREVRMSY